MNRNTELHFSNIPRVNIKRSIFDLSHSWKTSIDEGEITPMFLKEVLPGDTFDVRTNFVLRMTTPVKPVMDNAYIDLYYFFVPNRLAWRHWKEFMGENNSGAWDENKPTYKIPGLYGTIQAGISAGNQKIKTNALTRAFGVGNTPATSTPGGTQCRISKENAISQIPFRDYVLIYNEYFRNQNIEAPLETGYNNDSDQTFGPGESKVYAYRGGPLLTAYKFADYFTNALPGPQKGDPVTIGIGGEAPVTIENNGNFLFNGPNQDPTGDPFEVNLYARRGADEQFASIRSDMEAGLTSSLQYKSGLKATADLTSATLININDIRNAFAVQRQLEKDARAGTRYIEIIKENFGVTSSDARLQRPEYLGGGRYPISMQQVLQTSGTTGTGTNSGIQASAQGNTAAFSNTVESDKGFLKSFEEHGYIMGLAVIRTDNTYYQGIEKHWSRKDRFDFYFPTFANIGEQPILNKEIYFQDEPNYVEKPANSEVFGYQEAWAEYRYSQNKICGDLMDDNQKIWNYAEKITSQPYLSENFLKEGVGKIDQTLTATSSVISQFRVDFYHKVRATRPMPVYSVPGLIDHN